MPSLADRYGHSAIYDSVYQRMIIFGGYDAGGPGADAWAFSLPASGSGTWTKLAPAGTPPAARYQHSAIFDSANQRMIVFGGQDGTSPIVDGAWALSLPGSGDGAWTQLSPSGGPPDARESHSAIYDGVNHRMIIFGGEDASWNVREDVRALSLTAGGGGAWTQLTPASTPRLNHSAIYDGANHRMIIFGGEDSSRTAFKDVPGV